jgi:hypothetical protein
MEAIVKGASLRIVLQTGCEGLNTQKSSGSPPFSRRWNAGRLQIERALLMRRKLTASLLSGHYTLLSAQRD